MIDFFAVDDPWIVDDRHKIAEMFRRLCGEKKSINVHLDKHDHGSAFSTTILNVDLDGKKFILDTGPNPLLNIALSKPVTHAWLKSEMDGAKVYAPLERAVSAVFNGRGCLRLPLPAKMHYQQRRMSPRFRPNKNHPVWCSFPLSPKESRGGRARVFDVSLLGVGLIGFGNAIGIDTGHILTSCELTFPEQSIRVTLEVVRIESPGQQPGREPRIGCRFVGLNAKAHSSLHQAVERLASQVMAA